MRQTIFIATPILYVLTCFISFIIGSSSHDVSRPIVMKILYLSIIFFFLFSCSDSKYKMYDMAFDKYVSIDDLIESGEYTPEICEKRVDRIFKTKPLILGINHSSQLNKLLSKWATEEENFRRKQSDSTVYSHYVQNITKVTKYVYTYILSEKPMHVFTTCISSKKMQKTNCTTIYIRVDHEGNIIGNYSDSSPVQNSCDKEIKCSELH